ncbi:MAG: hypothetical protein FWE20_08685 [Defluviitaleaceae bacterium]|nr:hypothetical protein [Defluviitaleaceae bacterium]
MDKLCRDIIIIDETDIYTLSANSSATERDILTIYCQKVNKNADATNIDATNIDANDFWLIKHTKKLYSIDMTLAGRKQKEREGWRFDSIEIDIAGWWAQAYPIIEQIANVLGVTGGVFVFVGWVRKVIQAKSKYAEYEILQEILHKDEWNISDLAKELSISNEQAKNLLKGFGFIWDSRKMLYVCSKNTIQLCEKKGIRYQKKT